MSLWPVVCPGDCKCCPQGRKRWPGAGWTLGRPGSTGERSLQLFTCTGRLGEGGARAASECVIKGGQKQCMHCDPDFA